MSENKIKIIATTAEQFHSLDEFRKSFPPNCTEQIESVCVAFGGNMAVYKPGLKSLNLPENPYKLEFESGAKIYRARYKGYQIICHTEAAPERIDFW